MYNKQNLRNMDFPFVVAVILLLATCLIVLSTAFHNLVKGQPYYYVELQTMWILSGIFLAIMVNRIDYQRMQKFSWYIYGFNILLLSAVNTVTISSTILDAVKQGMRAVVTGEGDDAGTAAGIFADLPEFSGGAKTGTAQLGNVNTTLGKTYNGVFVAFAPYNNPQIAFAGVVEFGESGGSTAGYVAKAAFMKYFGWSPGPLMQQLN